MQANKVILNGETIIDLTQDTVIESDVAVGKTFHKKDGTTAVGTYVPSGVSGDVWNGAVIVEDITENATNGTYGLAYEQQSNGTYMCTGIGTAESEEIIIANEVNGQPVAHISDEAFYNNKRIRSLHVGGSVKRIPSGAFRLCSALESIYIEPGVCSSIRENAFRNCTYVTSVELPDNILHIYAGAFYGCSNITSIRLPEKLQTIGDIAFYTCSNLRTVEMYNYVTQINSRCFCSTRLNRIIYHGTKAQWYGIVKLDGWEDAASNAITVECEDGSVLI